jgi:hypothetical protein
MVAVLAGAAERELDHIGLPHDYTELAAQRGNQGPVAFPWFGGQPSAGAGEARVSLGGEQVFDRH